MSQKNEIKKNVAKKLLAQGYTISKTAEMLGVSRPVVSGWGFPKSAPWHVEALKMHYNHVSGRKIAKKLGLNHHKVARSRTNPVVPTLMNLTIINMSPDRKSPIN
jgi:uncharacterized protein YjcR